MGLFESIWFWAAIFMYTASFIAYSVSASFKSEKWGNWAWYLAIIGFGCQTAAIAARWIITQHAPVLDRFENNLAGSWFIMFVFFLMYRWFKKTKNLGIIMTPIVLTMLGYGVMGGAELQPLSPPFKSNWLWVHVTFAWFSYSAFAVAGGMGIVYLLKDYRADKGEKTPFLKLFPEAPLIEDIALKLVLFGFLSQSLMLISGSIWANSLWGNYWSWDPLETWSLVTWLTYGIILHFRLTLGWKGRRMAWLVVAALATEIITFWGIGFISDLHVRML